MTKKTPLLGKTLGELKAIVQDLGMPKFTAGQIASWLYDKKVGSIEEMTNLSLKNRERLMENYEVGASAPVHEMRSVDGTVKYLFCTPEGDYIESVYIPDDDRATLCVSSQVGCKMNCKFCMTGKQGYTTSLTTAQILNQIYSVPERDTLTNVVFMGMGEPFDNLDEVLRALEILTADYGYKWSPKRITVSTVGLRKGLERFLEESDCHLAISLHSPFPSQRRELMPAEKAFSITEMVEILRRYDFSKQRRLSFEYIVFKGVNDSLIYAKELVKLLRGLDCRMNLIRFHAIPNVDLEGTDMESMIAFRDYLTQHGLFATIRASRGEDIFAACGMLSTAQQQAEKKEKVKPFNTRNIMKRMTFYLGMALAVLSLASCRNGGKSIITPVSSGRPYEVMVVADDKCWMSPDSALFHVLDTDVPGLPQAERSFRISRVRPDFFDRSVRLFRNIIIVDIQDIYTQPKFKYTRDAYSSPQMIMTIQAPNQKEFADYVSKNGQVIIDFFTRAEMNRQVKLLEKKHNETLSTKVQSMFDCDIWMPVEMESYKQGENFLWASSNLNDLNFVMYAYPFRDHDTFTKEYFIHKRDSVMKVNLPGAREGMYMETADSIFVETRNIAVKGDYAFEARGLWEMKNDAMGGPFVSHVRVDRDNARVIVVEGFVYNPGKLKRDQIRKLNAALYTLKLPSEKEVSEIPVDNSISEEQIKQEAEQNKQ